MRNKLLIRTVETQLDLKEISDERKEGRREAERKILEASIH